MECMHAWSASAYMHMPARCSARGRAACRSSAGDCAAAVVRVRTGMACVLCRSSSLVGAGSSGRAWLRLVCWLLILIRAGYSEHGAPSLGAAAFACISWRASEGSPASCDVYTLRVCNCQ
eukprot:scaffold108389_cov69-Phaeocystis_antarctica.AAC.2